MAAVSGSEKKMDVKEYDVLVIGGGPAGYMAAIKAGRLAVNGKALAAGDAAVGLTQAAADCLGRCLHLPPKKGDR
jgi:pyruvate/2-oxoglutarate dehydrogenase complex dihydrolipoamide dehydrogenase (E3) component